MSKKHRLLRVNEKLKKNKVTNLKIADNKIERKTKKDFRNNNYAWTMLTLYGKITIELN